MQNPVVNETLAFKLQVEDELGLISTDGIEVSIDPAVIGQAKLGPIELADIELFKPPDLDNPIYFQGPLKEKLWPQPARYVFLKTSSRQDLFISLVRWVIRI